MGYDKGVLQLIERILKMKNVFVCIIMSISIMSCGNRNNKENPACGMTKAEAEAIAKKIDEEYEAANKAFKDYMASGENIRNIEDLEEIQARLMPLMSISTSAEPFVEAFDIKNPYEVAGKLFIGTARLIKFTTLMPWNNAIENKKEPSLEIAIYRRAAEAYQLNQLLDCHIENLKQKIAKLDRVKYAKTLELYSILMQAKSLYDEPRGSYMSMTQGLNELSSNFDKTKSLAELEWK